MSGIARYRSARAAGLRRQLEGGHKPMVWHRLAQQRFFWVAAVLLCLRLCGEASAQDTLGDSSGADSPGRTVVRAAASVVRQHRANAWSVLSVHAEHIPGETDQSEGKGGEGMVSVYFADTVDQQYVRRIWVPEGAQRQAFLPFRMPVSIPRSEGSIELQMASIEVGEGDREVFRRTDGDPLTDSILLSVDHDPVKTMAIYRRHYINEDDRMVRPDTDAVTTLHVARQSAKLSTNVTSYQEDFLPPWPEVYQQYHTMVLCGDRLAHDAAGFAAIRGWLRDGGRLWIMADRTPPSMISAILGNRHDLTMVDAVELDRYTIESPQRRSGDVIIDDCEFEEPVRFVRMATDRDDITATVNGWPAAIWFPFGEGEVLVTTLAPRGWVAEFEELPTEALREMMTRFFRVPEGGLDPELMQTAVTQQIGYSIPSRSFAVSLLAACCGCMTVAGLFLARRNQLEHLSWIIPAIALVTTGVFISTGLANSTSVPPTIAAMEVNRVLPGTNEVRTEGLAAIYDSQSRQVDWEAKGRQWAIPVPPSDGEVRRLIFLDDDTVLPANATTAAGSVGTARLSAETSSATPLAVTAHFGPDGLEGRFEGENRMVPSDAVIVQASMPGLSVTPGDNGQLTAPAENVLAPGEYIAGGLLSDEQARRHSVLQQLLDPGDAWVFPQEPALLSWSEKLQLEESFPADFTRIGAALDVIPLSLEATPPGTSFTIPSTFLKPSIEPGRSGTSTAYSVRSGQWVKGLTRGGETVLRFELPAEVRPCTLTGGSVSLRCTIPSRQLEVWAYVEPEPIKVMTRANPSGVLTIPLSAEHLVMDSGGGVRIGFFVTDIEEPETDDDNDADDSAYQDTGWQIDYARLTLTGETLPARDQP
jgi:hypothetical protein